MSVAATTTQVTTVNDASFLMESSNDSVPEMTFAGKYHSQSVFVCGRNDFRIADRATRVDDGGRPCRSNRIEAIAKRKKCIGGHNRPLQRSRSAFHARDIDSVDAAYLPRANGERTVGRREDDSVRFHVSANPPGEPQRCPLVG